MRVNFQLTFEDWVAGQIFAVEQMTALQKQDKKLSGGLILYWIVLMAIMLCIGGADTVFWIFAVVVGVWVVYRILNRSASQRKTIYHRLTLAYGTDYEKENSANYWDIGPEYIITGDSLRENRFRWEGVRRIVSCPDFLFVSFGNIGGTAQVPRRAIAPAEYQTFCEELIRLYREQAAKEGKIAEVVHSDWKLDLNKLR